MELETFIDDFDGAALDMEEFAEVAATITDCPELANAAEKYLDALVEFVARLGQYVEVG